MTIREMISRFSHQLKHWHIIALLLTISRVIISVMISFLLGFFVLIIYILFPSSMAFFNPIIQIMRSTPLAVLSIFIFIIIGDKIGPYVITVLMTFPVVIEGLLTATKQINKDVMDEVKTLQGSSLKKIVYI